MIKLDALVTDSSVDENVCEWIDIEIHEGVDAMVIFESSPDSTHKDDMFRFIMSKREAIKMSKRILAAFEMIENT